MRIRPDRLFLCAAALSLAAGTASAGHRHRNVSTDHDEPKSCADIHVIFDDRDAVRAEERATIPAGGTVRFEAAENSGITVREDARSDFEVVLCKAAPTEEALPRISLATSAGKVSVNGPSDEDWTGHLIVTAPRGASIEAFASNGPIALIGLSGRVTARSENGPISARRSTGELDLEAENGPIAFHGESGHSKLRTQNGPIGVTLQGRAWEGEGLDARAVNGPVSLSIPPGYASAAVVESAGRSPFQCRGEACGAARKTWDDDGRRIEVGEGPVLVRVATVNGPVSVKTGGGRDDDE
jgi:DUF4097 and DUF4098 domain-containing protein YvlB